MNSTSTHAGYGRGVAYASSTVVSTRSAVKGIYTSASNLSSGQTSSESYDKMQISSRRNSPTYPVPEGACDHCQWVWVDDLYEPGLGGYVCAICDADILNGCQCGGDCHCDVPITEDKDVWAFIAALAGAYALYKVRAGKTPYGDVRDDREMVAG